MQKIQLIILGLILNIPLVAFAQKGTIRGTVVDNNNGEPLYGVTVIIENTTDGAITDFDGKFEISAKEGIYNLQLSYISYSKLTIQNVEVKPEEVTLLSNIRLMEDVEQLQEVVVTAGIIKDNEEALLTVKRKSANLLDGISAANFKKIGDSDAASAAKRIPGVSIEGGKYVYIRGLGDRYTKTTLNGMDIPGLDPERNTLQMDIFPTGIIDNIIVFKSFTADLPADFTGGVLNVQTKDFPEEKVMGASLNLGYNPTMHFNKDYLTYNGGKTDFLGFDDGTRQIPTNRSTDIPMFGEVVGNPDGKKGQQYQQILQGFNPTMAALESQSMMNFGMGFNVGDQLKVKNNTLGYNVALTYKNNTSFYKDVQYGSYGLNSDPANFEMESRELQSGRFGTNNVLMGGLVGLALKKDLSKYRFDVLHLQNGESSAGIFDFKNLQQGAEFEAIQHNLEYSQRSLTNLLLNGEHVNDEGSWMLEWKVSPTRSIIEDPDVRFSRLEMESSGYRISTEAGFPQRIWRFLKEDNLAGIVDISKDYDFKNESAKLKFGAGHTYKNRNFEIQIFDINARNIPLSDAGNPDEIFYKENLWPYQGNVTRGTTYEPQFIPVNPNLFESSVHNSAVYVSNEFMPFPGVKAILGIRAENFIQRYTGRDQLGNNILNNDVVLEELNFFPSVNLIYSVKDSQNLRISFSRTIARPSFKELSFSEIYDPLTNRTFIGGLFRDANDIAGVEYWDGNLTSTDINNFDVRYEVFQSKGQTISISGFYKTFSNPIEIVQFATQPGAFQPRNVGNGQVLGAELEFRKRMDFISPALNKFSITGNATVAESRIELSETEYNSRVENARQDQPVKQYRDMAGQAPYLINLGIGYGDEKTEAGIFYNVQGETLRFVGIVDRPDVYSVPFHSLNFTANRYMGKSENFQIGFKIENLLGDEKEEIFKSFNAENKVFSNLKPATTFNFSLKYSL